MSDRGASRKLFLVLVHYFDHVRRNAAEIAILHADISVHDRDNVVLGSYCQPGFPRDARQVIDQLLLSILCRFH